MSRKHHSEGFHFSSLPSCCSVGPSSCPQQVRPPRLLHLNGPTLSPLISQMRRVWRENAGKVRNSYLGTEMPSLMINKSGNVVACDFVSSYEPDSSHHCVITRFWERRSFQQATVTLLRREKTMSCEVSYLGTKNGNGKC